MLLALLALPCAVLASRADEPLQDLKAQYRRETTVPFPSSDPYSAAKLRLGRMLFFEPKLSGPGTRSCATCHNPALSWGDGLPRAVGEQALTLRSPTLLGVAWIPVLGWDGKYPTLEDVAIGPMLSPANMNITEREALRRLSAIAGYRAAFAEAFPRSDPHEAVSRTHLEQALATFERTIVAAPAPFDAWIEGNEEAIGERAKRGFLLFTGKAGCAECHSGPNFTDGSFQDIGLAAEDDIGRGRLFPSSVKLQHAFKVPTLRDVARRAPYMHDGSLPDLAAVVAAYDQGGIDRPSRSELIHPLSLTPEERSELVAFLRTLTGDPQPFEAPELPR
ncbi:MAG: cytochrome c peroxidase [Acetobacteraceae bacterium]|nr:cytochrome c peroxidase [Acetobacteraceae bacterium]